MGKQEIREVGLSWIVLDRFIGLFRCVRLYTCMLLACSFLEIEESSSACSVDEMSSVELVRDLHDFCRFPRRMERSSVVSESLEDISDLSR